MPTHSILFLSKGEDSASTRYRALQFFDDLTRAGYAPRHLSMTGGMESYWRVLQAARRADIVVIVRKLLPWPLLWLLRRQARKLVFDFDDAVFCNSDGSASPTRHRRFAAMARHADHVLCGNRFLCDHAARFNTAVSHAPTAIDTARYALQTEKPDAPITLVWIGSRSTRKYLQAAMPALEQAAHQVPGLTLKIVADFTLSAPTLHCIAVRWSAEREAAELASAHIGIAPMQDNDWTRGKCALKVLQYMAAGLPVVSSRAGVNAEIVKESETGFLAQTPEQWTEAIAQLAASPELRERMGRAGREAVAPYDRTRVFETLRGVFDQLVHAAS